jgi:magnesium-protoporphyrin IX monomethyl ester (oxidative) cyclase
MHGPSSTRRWAWTFDEYDMKVFRITSEISKQVFPFTLDLDNPAFMAGLKKLLKVNKQIAEAKASGGVIGKARQAMLGAQAGMAFLQLYMVPVKDNELPDSSRLQPAW